MTTYQCAMTWILFWPKTLGLLDPLCNFCKKNLLIGAMEAPQIDPISVIRSFWEVWVLAILRHWGHFDPLSGSPIPFSTRGGGMAPPLLYFGHFKAFWPFWPSFNHWITDNFCKTNFLIWALEMPQTGILKIQIGRHGYKNGRKFRILNTHTFSPQLTYKMIKKLIFLLHKTLYIVDFCGHFEAFWPFWPPFCHRITQKLKFWLSRL